MARNPIHSRSKGGKTSMYPCCNSQSTSIPAGDKTMACSRSEREMMPLTTSALSTRTRRWTCNEQGNNNKLRQGSASHCSYYTFIKKKKKNVLVPFLNARTSALTIRSMMVSMVSSRKHVMTPSTNPIRLRMASCMVMSRLWYVLWAARFWRGGKNGTLWASQIWNEPTLVCNTYNDIKFWVKSHHFS